MKDLAYTPMTTDDLPVILRIERECFANPWSRPMFERDMLHNKLAHIFTVRQEGRIVGYFSVWKIVDEGHLVTLAVDPPARRQGIGSTVLREIIRLSREIRIRKLTLEVRENNSGAIRMYNSFGFIKAGVRLKYYEDGTDAWIMDLQLDPAAAGRDRGAAA